MNLVKKDTFKNFAGFCLLFLSIFSIKSLHAADFTVTGYYSPLPKQEFYLTGDYKSEIRLNGKGIQAADGTNVYHGMIAAPSNYKFGTNICLSKLGCGKVHDRGGAIVNKGVRKKAVNDRLDFWMGYGIEGLKKSLLWGVRNVSGNIVNASAGKNSSARAPKISPIILDIIRDDKIDELFEKNLYPGANDDSVKKLKESLTFINIFRSNINNKYDNELKKAVLDFQIKYKVIENESEIGAGLFGPKTREKMMEVLPIEIDKYLKSKWPEKVFLEDLSEGDHGITIYRLQQILIDKGFLENGTTGFFGPKTKQAIKDFQIKYGLIKNNKSTGAGSFGPKTREKMTELWIAKRNAYFPLSVKEAEVLVVESANKNEGELVAVAPTKLVFVGSKEESVKEVEKVNKFDDSVILFRGKRNADVRKLQRELKKLGFFAGNTTGFYGDETAEAVLSFQFKHNIVESRRSIGASVFGPSTRVKINELI